MIRILHIHTLPIISGSGINTFLSMSGMDRRTYNVDLACAPGGTLIDLALKHRFRVITFKNLVQPLRPLKDILALFKLVLFLKKRPYHIVHTHNSKAGFIGRLAAKMAGTRIVVHTVHGFAFHAQEPVWRRWLFRNLERFASLWCDKLIFISQPLIDWALRERIAPEDKMVKIYSGIELDQFRPLTEEKKKRIRQRWGLGQEDPVVGIVSKLWEGKGHAVLIEAFKKVKEEIGNAKLVIVGEGQLFEELEEKVARLGLKNDVVFTGFLMDVSEILASFDVAVLPSFFEGMGRVLLEAMAMKKPVVASRVGGIPDLVEHAVNGLLVSPGNVEELTEAITKILKDKNLAHRMGAEGRRKITEQFSADLMVTSIEKVYREMLKTKGVRVDH